MIRVRLGPPSATTSAATLLGWDDRVGALAPGLYADIVYKNLRPAAATSR
jgi:imidazolonepropionase-like amidohydrolase